MSFNDFDEITPNDVWAADQMGLQHADAKLGTWLVVGAAAALLAGCGGGAPSAPATPTKPAVAAPSNMGPGESAAYLLGYGNERVQQGYEQAADVAGDFNDTLAAMNGTEGCAARVNGAHPIAIPAEPVLIGPLPQYQEEYDAGVAAGEAAGPVPNGSEVATRQALNNTVDWMQANDGKCFAALPPDVRADYGGSADGTTNSTGN